jgi:elongation factor G
VRVAGASTVVANYGLAIVPRTQADDDKLNAALQRLQAEDPVLRVERVEETKQTVLRGIGDTHIAVTLERLARKFGVHVDTSEVRVPYRETVVGNAAAEGKVKKQSGGHGQFADVKIDIAPRERGSGFEFVDKIVGGAVPRNFIPAVAEAAEESARKGPFGFPVVDISVTLVDGGFHSVDSSDMAFKTATSLAMKEGMAKAEPILLEPVNRVTITVPNEFTPRAQRLLTGRRGQILGFAEREGWPGWDDVEALVPEAELHDLIIDLRSQTLGLGTYRKRFDHLAESRAEMKRGAA